MGSPALALKVGDRLRPFIHAGLTHVFRSATAAETSAPDEAASHQGSIMFPPPWDSFVAKAKPGARVVFTYYELGLDLSGQADPRRGGLFREILQLLGWAGQGVHSFWPLTAPCENGLEESSQMFWQGVRFIGAGNVVCFGRRSAQVITGQEDPKAFPMSCNGCTVHLLPSPQRMLGMLPHERHLAAEVLRRIRIN